MAYIKLAGNIHLQPLPQPLHPRQILTQEAGRVVPVKARGDLIRINQIPPAEAENVQQPLKIRIILTIAPYVRSAAAGVGVSVVIDVVEEGLRDQLHLNCYDNRYLVHLRFAFRVYSAVAPGSSESGTTSPVRAMALSV